MFDKFLEKKKTIIVMLWPTYGGHLCSDEVDGGPRGGQLRRVELHEVDWGDSGIWGEWVWRYNL